MSCGATTDQVLLSYVEETTFGVSPTPPGSTTLKDIRVTAESFTQENTTAVSNEVGGGRGVKALIITDVNAALQCGGSHGDSLVAL